MNGIVDNENPDKVNVNEVGVKAGDFVLKNQAGEDWKLSDYLG